ncbi:MAG: type VI secretion system-associated domain-containing protein [bacterium]|nr:type VI secretion system-associated domain-containing protein [bacterium]
MDGSEEQQGSSLLASIRRRLRGPKRIEAAVSAYGKLPLYKDFIRLGPAGREAQALRQWLDRGISHYWADRDETREHPIGLHGFLLSFPGSRRQLLGSLWGSHDQGELRRFPFTFFAALPGGRDAFPRLSSLAVLDQVVDKAADMRRELAAAADVDHFYKRFRGATWDLVRERDDEIRERLIRETAEVTIGELASSLYGEAGSQEWPALLAYLRRRLGSGSGMAFAARLPTSPLLPLRSQVAFWCALLAAWGYKVRTPCNLLFALEDECSGIALIARELRPEDVFVFHPEMPEYEFIEDLRQAVPRAAGEEIPSSTPADRPLASLLAPGVEETEPEEE